MHPQPVAGSKTTPQAHEAQQTKLCFIYLYNFLFNYTVSSSDYIERKYGSIMNLEGFGKKRPWPTH
jgi:hypothetical protein